MSELKFVMDVDIPSIVEQHYRDASNNVKDVITNVLSVEMNKCCQKIIDDYAENLSRKHQVGYKAGYRNGCEDTLDKVIQCLERNADAYHGDLGIYDAINLLRAIEEVSWNET